MSVDVVVPKVGLTVETVEVLAWHKAPGDAVHAGETLVELAADKADLEIEAPADGTLLEIRAQAGDTVPPGAVLAIVGAAGERAPAAGNGRRDGRLRISPLARRFAADRGIDVATLAGSGPRGRIVRRDVEAAVASSPPAPTAAAATALAPTGSGRAVGDGLTPARWTAARRATARLMSLSQTTIPPVTLHRRAPAERALRTIRHLKAEGLPATFSHALLVSCARALPAHPALNAFWEGEELLRSGPVHLGMAVDDGGDLLSAVVADAADRDVTGLVMASVEAVARAKARERPAVQATFTLSNLGMFGVEQFTPIVNPPQVAVLGVGAVVDGRCHLSLTFDHRAVDGAPAARFLAEVCDRLAEFDGR